MERIKQALERARRERASGAGIVSASAGAPVAAGVGTSAPSPRAARGRAAGAAPAHAPAAITYTSTRTVAVSDAVFARHRLIPGLTCEPANDAYRVLRTQVLQRMRLNGWNTLAVTSPGAGEGKTLTAINLAISLARDEKHTVALCDLDLKRPRVHEYLSLDDGPGIGDVLFGSATLPEALVNPGIAGLVVLPGREPVHASSEALASPAMMAMVEEMKSRYSSRLLVFDLPPLAISDDALAFLPCVDAVLLIVAQGRTERSFVERAQELLGSTPILGTVLNRADAPDTRGY